MEKTDKSFLERLKHSPILCDGAMGTMLYSRGVPFDRCFDELNLSRPDLVRDIHQRYVEAGAEIIETNTFGANRFKLAGHGLESQVAEINRHGARIAREASQAAGRPVFVAGSVGPLGKTLAPIGRISPAEARAAFQEQITALAEGGVDVLILETISDLDEMREAVLAARAACDLPIMAQMTFTEDGTTARGDTPVQIVATLEDLGVAVIGANCSVGSQPMLAVIEEMARLTQVPLSAQPNAGFPAYVGGRYMYPSSPEYMAAYARRMVEAGAQIVGGCCGTTPQHIALMRETLDFRPPETRPAPAIQVVAPQPAVLPPAAQPTRLSQKLRWGQFVVTVEVDPPKGFDLSRVLPRLKVLQGSGLIDAINVADNPRAQARLSALAMSTLLHRELGLETVLHLTTRHRNMVALYSELMGAHALGVRNVFVVMGDLPRIGDYPDATPVSDITPSGLIRLIKCFNQGVDLAGKPIEQPTSYCVGCALSMGAEDLDRELRVLARKIKAGADFILTQPVYDVEVLERCWQRLEGFPRPLLMGLLPLHSERHAEFLHNEVPGITIPKSVREAMRKAGPAGKQEGVRQAQELLDQVKDKISGIYFMPAFGRYEVVAEVMHSILEVK